MFLSLIFSFQNRREYYKNCTTCQPGGLYAPLSVPERRSTPIFMPYFRRRRHLVRFPAWTFWQPTARRTIGIPRRSTICSDTPPYSRCSPCHPVPRCRAQPSDSCGYFPLRIFPGFRIMCGMTPYKESSSLLKLSL